VFFLRRSFERLQPLVVLGMFFLVELQIKNP
jgi:hypothetical protein